MSYKHNKAWRLRNTDKRNAERKRNYHKHPGLYLAGAKWTVEDSDFVLAATAPDRALHVLLGRSVQAIQIRRCKLRKREATK